MRLLREEQSMKSDEDRDLDHGVDFAHFLCFFLFFTGERVVIFVVVVVAVNVRDIDKPGFLLLDAAFDL